MRRFLLEPDDRCPRPPAESFRRSDYRPNDLSPVPTFATRASRENLAIRYLERPLSADSSLLRQSTTVCSESRAVASRLGRTRDHRLEGP